LRLRRSMNSAFDTESLLRKHQLRRLELCFSAVRDSATAKALSAARKTFFETNLPFQNCCYY
jgi:hypothetical protein